MTNATSVHASVPAARPAAGVSPQEEFLAQHVGDSILVKPVPVMALRRGGPRPLRVLLFGGGPLVGWGLRDHNLGLAGHVADRLAATARRGVEMDVVADEEPVRQAAVEGVRGLRLWRYDAIVAVLGQPSPKGSVDDHAYWTAELVRTLLLAGGATAALLVFDSSLTAEIPRSMRARTAARFLQTQRDAAERACTQTDRVRFDELSRPFRLPAEGRPFDRSQFEEWGEDIAHRVLQQLEQLRAAAPVVTDPVVRPDDERFRQRALDSLRLGRDANPRLEQLVRQARATFGAAGAAINIIDNDRQWSKVALPVDLDMPRDHAFCNHAIEVDRSTLINDTQKDPRVADNPLSERIRFYAAHPIRTWDGYRIGTLCVYGPEPRKLRPSDLEPLRELAGLAEQELWSSSLKPHAPGE